MLYALLMHRKYVVDVLEAGRIATQVSRIVVQCTVLQIPWAIFASPAGHESAQLTVAIRTARNPEFVLPCGGGQLGGVCAFWKLGRGAINSENYRSDLMKPLDMTDDVWRSLRALADWPYSAIPSEHADKLTSSGYAQEGQRGLTLSQKGWRTLVPSL